MRKPRAISCVIREAFPRFPRIQHPHGPLVTSFPVLSHQITEPSPSQPFSPASSFIYPSGAPSHSQFGLFPIFPSFLIFDAPLFMGSCFSSTSIYSSQPTAKVVTFDGSLKQYSAPILASDVLGEDCRSFFICSADRLYFDAHIPALGTNELLQLGQIYFTLPIAKLEYPLTGLDMAALAAKASSALSVASRKRGNGRGIRIMPVVGVCEEVGDGDVDGFQRFDCARVEILAERSMVMEKKVGKGISMRGRMRTPRYRGKLSTIEEGNE